MSWRRLVRKLRLALRSPPRSARDVVSDYREYLRLQTETYRSFESDVPEWVAAQRRYFELAFSNTDRSARVLDCACGDGAGLRALTDLGFERVLGVELSAEKSRRSQGSGAPVVRGDMHDLSFLRDASFDAIVSSHTLEHAYEPKRVLVEFRRLLAPGGTLHIVLPYPDPGPRNELAHVGKYELGTDVEDGGSSVGRFIERVGFRVDSVTTDDRREPELWVRASR